MEICLHLLKNFQTLCRTHVHYDLIHSLLDPVHLMHGFVRRRYQTDNGNERHQSVMIGNRSVACRLTTARGIASSYFLGDQFSARCSSLIVSTLFPESASGKLEFSGKISLADCGGPCAFASHWSFLLISSAPFPVAKSFSLYHTSATDQASVWSPHPRPLSP